jgi:sporadic carbohydrate cluster 2OG-Fe(II) oxygenase
MMKSMLPSLGMAEETWIDVPEHARSFMKDGYCVVPALDAAGLARIRSLLVAGLRGHVSGGDGLDDETYLNRFHTFVDMRTLNDVRVKVHAEVCGSEEFKRLVFRMVDRHLFGLIGNEIVMQRQVNFVTHLPGDAANIIYLHTDSWSGCSPYEVILWLPLVDVFATKSMYILDLATNRKHLEALEKDPSIRDASQLMARIRPEARALEMKFGSALLFSPILLHGAEVNRTDETRFILNVRFKALFSPYGTKALGETFMPVNYLPATQVGLDYESRFGVVGA